MPNSCAATGAHSHQRLGLHALQTHGMDALEIRGLHEERVLVALAALQKFLRVFLIENRTGVVHLEREHTVTIAAARWYTSTALVHQWQPYGSIAVNGISRHRYHTRVTIQAVAHSASQTLRTIGTPKVNTRLFSVSWSGSY